MKSIGNDFSGEMTKASGLRWRLWLVVLALHMLFASGLNAALSLNRQSATHSAGAIDVAILPPEPALAPAPEPRHTPEPMPVLAIVTTPVSPAENPSAGHSQHGLRASSPESVLLKYNVQKDRDSAKASLNWRVSKPAADGAAPLYELTYEASYFGVSLIKQTSTGTLGAAGLMPTRFSDKRRGKSEQAAHFDSGKALRVTFSNNRAEAMLAVGSQDRASVLIQLSSLAAANPNRFKAGDVMELPVASVDELEQWQFEVQGLERLALPIGDVPAIRLLRRPRRAFDQTVEVWLAPSLTYLPVRIRYTDSSGVTDSLLASVDRL